MKDSRRALDTPVTVADRLATAVVSGAAAFATIALFGMILLLRAGEGSSTDFWRAFLYSSGGFVALAAVVGFLAGPERAAVYWGLIWGTEDSERHRAPMIAILAFVILFCLMILWM